MTGKLGLGEYHSHGVCCMVISTGPILPMAVVLTLSTAKVPAVASTSISDVPVHARRATACLPVRALPRSSDAKSPARTTFQTTRCIPEMICTSPSASLSISLARLPGFTPWRL